MTSNFGWWWLLVFGIVLLKTANSQTIEDVLNDAEEKSKIATSDSKKKCKTTAGELIFILDDSTSVGPDNFNIEKEFATKIVDRLVIGKKSTRVAMITYNSFPSLIFNLDKYSSSKDINSAIRKAEFSEGITAVGDALNHVIKHIEKKTRPGNVGKVIILVSDGKRNGGMDPILVSKQLKASNYSIIAIGLNKDSDKVALKAIASKNEYYLIKEYSSLKSIVRTVVTKTCTKFHQKECPKTKVKRGKCSNEKQTVHVTSYYSEKGRCIKEQRRYSIKCLKPNGCPKTDYAVEVCQKGMKEVSVMKLEYIKMAGRCVKKSTKIKKAKCGCPKDKATKTKVITSNKCKDGVLKRILMYFTYENLRCVRGLINLPSVKCSKICHGTRKQRGTCRRGLRTVKKYQLVYKNEQCVKKLVSKTKEKCITKCPKSIKLTSKLCVNGKRAVKMISFSLKGSKCIRVTHKLKPKNCKSKKKCTKKLKIDTTPCKNNRRSMIVKASVPKNGKCIWKVIKKKLNVKCTNKCPKSRTKKTRCIKGKQYLLRVSFKKSGKKCKSITTKVKTLKCGKSRKCRKLSKFFVKKCSKKDKFSHLYKVYYKTSKSGGCIKKTKKLKKKIACKCYKVNKKHIQVKISRKCSKGYRKRVLHYYEERKGKCTHVKFSLRRVKCEKVKPPPPSKKCSKKLKIKTTACKNNRRNMTVLKQVSKNGKCTWKVFKKKSNVKCTNKCPKSRTKKTRCIKGKQYLLRVSFKKSGKKCKSITTKVKTLKCGKSRKCRKLSKFFVKKCSKKDKFSHLYKVYYKTSKSGGCIKKTKKLKKKIACKCYKVNKKHIQVKISRKCSKGYRKRVLHYYEERKGKCTHVKFSLRRVKCEKVKPPPNGRKCKNRKPKYIYGKCKNGKQSITVKVQKLWKGKCIWKMVRKRKIPCKKCPKNHKTTGKCIKNKQKVYQVKYKRINGSCLKKRVYIKTKSCTTRVTGKKCSKKMKIKTTACKNNRRNMTVLKHVSKNGKCVWKVYKKKSNVKCENKCPKSRTKKTRCIKGKQYLLRVSFKKSGKKCKSITTKVKTLKCGKTKGCPKKRKYKTGQCKNGKRTIKVYGYNKIKNGKCKLQFRKTMTVKCNNKCPKNKTKKSPCIKGKRLILQRFFKVSKKGGCKMVRVKTNIVKCQKKKNGCSKKLKIVTSKCKANKRSVRVYAARKVKGKCIWKLKKKEVAKCKRECPRPKLKKSPCVLGRRLVMKIVFKKTKKGSCKSSKIKVGFRKCGGGGGKKKKCSKRVLAKVGICRNNRRSISLYKLKSKRNSCVWKLIKTKRKRCNSRCPKPKTIVTRCILNRQFIIRRSYRRVASVCLPKVKKLKLRKCKKCPNKVAFRAKHCKKGDKTTKLYRVISVNCKSKRKHVDNLSCSCYSQNLKGLRVKVDKRCSKNGYKYGTVKYYNRKSGKDKSLKCIAKTRRFKLRKCRRRRPNKCKKLSIKISVCQKGYRTIKLSRGFLKYIGKSKKKQCVRKVIRSRRFKCRRVCPKSGTRKSKKCLMNRRMVVFTNFKRVGGFCVMRRTKIKFEKCKRKTGKRCRRRIRVSLGKCKNGKGKLTLIGYVRRNKKCMKIKHSDEVSCTNRCSRRRNRHLVGGKCRKSRKNIYLVMNRRRGRKCIKKIIFIGRIKCKKC